MHETSKAMRRRRLEDEAGLFKWGDIFKGAGLDVGAGDDALPFENCQPFDKPHGDANKLDTYFKPETFSYVHASQCLEHLYNPADALERWLKVLKVGGHLIITVPDFDAYEKRCWPSRYNPDHKAAFSLWRHGFNGVPLFYHVPTMIAKYTVCRCGLIMTNYNFQLPESIDQTYHEDAGVECWIEFIIKK